MIWPKKKNSIRITIGNLIDKRRRILVHSRILKFIMGCPPGLQGFIVMGLSLDFLFGNQVKDMDERTYLVLGDMLEVIQSKVIAIIGVGGVGSYAVESLGRLGIKKLILVDYDTIDITNLNRQIMTGYQNIGKSKFDEG